MGIFANTQIRFTQCNFVENTQYGFAIKATIPDYSPSFGANVFTIEIGYTGKKVNTCGMSKDQSCTIYGT